MGKVTMGVSIDKVLLDKIDSERRKQSVKESKDISRSAYMTKLIEKGLSTK